MSKIYTDLANNRPLEDGITINLFSVWIGENWQYWSVSIDCKLYEYMYKHKDKQFKNLDDALEYFNSYEYDKNMLEWIDLDKVPF